MKAALNCFLMGGGIHLSFTHFTVLIYGTIVALREGVWGFPSNRSGTTRGLPKLSQIKENDIIIFVQNWKSAPTVKVSGGRASSKDYVGTFGRIVGVVVTKGFYEPKNPHPFWLDNAYPYRFDFRKEPLFVGHNVPCTQKALGKSLHEILRVMQVNGSVEKIDTSMIVKLMSLCTS